MKRKLAVIILAILISGVAIAVYAMDKTTVSTAAECCACCKDSCPMKSADAANTAASAKCDRCKDGESCPMGSAMAGDAKHAEMMKQKQDDPEHAAKMKKMAESGEACPMMHGMKGDPKHAEMMKGMKDDPKHAEMMKEMHNNPDHAAMMKKMSADGKGPGCACCKHKAAKKNAPTN